MKPQSSYSITLALAALLVGLSPLNAQESFEPPFAVDATNSVGDVGVEGSYQGYDPSDGNQLLLTTINDSSFSSDPDLTSQSGTDAVNGASLNSFFNLANGTIRNGSNAGTEGSAFKLTITLGVGDVLTFDHNFITREDNQDTFNSDFAFALLTLGGTLVQYTVLNSVDNANGFTPDFGEPGAGIFFYAGESGVFSFTAASAGTYTLGIGVADATTTDIASGLLVDNITVVPEPSTYALLGAGALLLLGWNRRRARARA